MPVRLCTTVLARLCPSVTVICVAHVSSCCVLTFVTSRVPARCRVVVPEPGYWHSSPTSLYMIRCPNKAACVGDGVVDVSGTTSTAATNTDSTTVAMAETLDSIGSADTRTLRLAVCQEAWYAGSIDKLLAGTNRLTLPPTNLTTWPCVLANDNGLVAGGGAASPQLYTQQQCAEGHAGNLCAACQPGYVSSPDFTCEQCPEDASEWCAGKRNTLCIRVCVCVCVCVCARTGWPAMQSASLAGPYMLCAERMGIRSHAPTQQPASAAALHIPKHCCAILSSSSRPAVPAPSPPSAAHTAGIAFLMLCVHVYFITWLAIQHFREIAPRHSDKEDGDDEGAGGDSSGGKEGPGDRGGGGSDGGGESASLGEVIKLGVLHFQQLLIIWRLNIDYPPIITRYVGAMGAATTSLTSFFAYQPACLLGPDLDSSEQSRLAYLYGVMSPFIALACSLALWSLWCVGAEGARRGVAGRIGRGGRGVRGERRAGAGQQCVTVWGVVHKGTELLSTVPWQAYCAGWMSSLLIFTCRLVRAP